MVITQTQGMSTQQKLGVVLLTMIAVIATMLPELASAGTGGAAFDDVWIWLKDNIQGTGGRIVCILIVVVGTIAGIKMGGTGQGFIGGLLCAIGLYNSPPVLETMISATVPYTEVVIQAIQLSNGL